MDELKDNLRQLLGLSPDYECLFLQGGGSLQFSMIPMNFLRGQPRPAAYIDSGCWSHQAIPDARLEGPVEVLWSGAADAYVRLPADGQLDASRDYRRVGATIVAEHTIDGFRRTLFRWDLASG